MNSTDDIWVPSYYRRRHPFLWVRAAGGPQVVDWVCGAVFAVLVLVTLVRAPHQAQTSAAVVATATTPDSDTNADRVAYASQASAVDK